MMWIVRRSHEVKLELTCRLCVHKVLQMNELLSLCCRSEAIGVNKEGGGVYSAVELPLFQLLQLLHAELSTLLGLLLSRGQVVQLSEILLVPEDFGHKRVLHLCFGFLQSLRELVLASLLHFAKLGLPLNPESLLSCCFLDFISLELDTLAVSPFELQ